MTLFHPAAGFLMVPSQASFKCQIVFEVSLIFSPTVCKSAHTNHTEQFVLNLCCVSSILHNKAALMAHLCSQAGFNRF